MANNNEYIWQDMKIKWPRYNVYYYDSIHGVNKLEELKELLHGKTIEIRIKDENSPVYVIHKYKQHEIEFINCIVSISYDYDKVRLKQGNNVIAEAVNGD